MEQISNYFESRILKDKKLTQKIFFDNQFYSKESILKARSLDKVDDVTANLHRYNLQKQVSFLLVKGENFRVDAFCKYVTSLGDFGKSPIFKKKNGEIKVFFKDINVQLVCLDCNRGELLFFFKPIFVFEFCDKIWCDELNEILLDFLSIELVNKSDFFYVKTEFRCPFDFYINRTNLETAFFLPENSTQNFSSEDLQISKNFYYNNLARNIFKYYLII